MSTIVEFAWKSVCLIALSILLPLLTSYAVAFFTGGIANPAVSNTVFWDISRKRDDLLITEKGAAGDQKKLEKIAQEKEELSNQEKKLKKGAAIAFYVLVLIGIFSLAVSVLLVTPDYLTTGFIVGGILCLFLGYLHAPMNIPIPTVFRILPLFLVLLLLIVGSYWLSQRRSASYVG